MTTPSPRSLARSVGWLLLSHIAVLIVGFATVIAVSRVGPEELGLWRLAQALLTYLLVGADAGLSMLAIREIARRPADAASYAGPILVVRFAIAFVLLSLAFVVIDPMRSPDDDAWFYMVMFLGVVPASLSLIHVVQGFARMRTFALARLVSAALGGLVGLALFVATHNLILLVVPVIVLSLLVNSALVVVVRREFKVEIRTGTPALWIDLVRASVPFLVAAIAVLLVSNVDAIIIGTMRGKAELGVYAAAYVLAGQLLLLAGPVALAIYPRLASLHGATAGFERAVSRVAGLLGLLVMPICIGAAILAGEIVRLLYGERYEGAAAMLAVLLAMPLVGYYNVSIGLALNAARHQNAVARIAILAAVVNVTLNLMLVITVGPIGAAVAAVITEVVTAAAYTRAVVAVTGLDPLRQYVAPLPAALVMGIVVFVAASIKLPLPAIVGFGAATYALLVWARPPAAVDTIRGVMRL